MKQLTFTHSVPLEQDAEGTVRVLGTRVTLDTLMAAFNKGNTAEQIQDSFPSLSLAQIYGVIAWYLDNQKDAEEYFKARQTDADTMREEIESQPEYGEFRETIRQRRAQMIKTRGPRLVGLLTRSPTR